MPALPLLAALLALTPEQGTGAPHLLAVHTPVPPLIDGRLDEPVWRTAPGSSLFTQSFGPSLNLPKFPGVVACVERTLATRRLNAIEYASELDGVARWKEARMVPSGAEEVLNLR